MQKQDKFSPRDYRTDADYAVFDRKFRDAGDLEYAVLLAHVMIEDQLRAHLAARLGADTMPPLRGFEIIAGLALAGAKAVRLRNAVGLLNVARNEVGHKLTRKKFKSSVEEFVRNVKGKAGRQMTWPTDEADQIDELQLAVRFYMVEIAFATAYEERVRELGDAAIQRRKRRRRAA